MNQSALLLAVPALSLLPLSLAAVDVMPPAYYRLYSLDQVQGTSAANQIVAFAFDGPDLYVSLNKTSSPQASAINRVDANGQVTELYSAATQFTSQNAFGVSSGVVQTLNTVGRDVWRVSGSGSSVYVSSATIASFLLSDYGVTANAAFTAGGATNPATGEFAFYVSTVNARGIFTTNAGGVSTLIAPAALSSVINAGDPPANPSLSGGMTFNGDGSVLFFGSNSNNGIFSYNLITGTGGLVLGAADVNGTASMNAASMFYAPDGRVYFTETSAAATRSIYSFDPANPVGTITQVLSYDQIAAGPAGDDRLNPATALNLGPLGWYEGNLAFGINLAATAGSFGVYVVPEPSTWALGLLGAGVAGWMLRRRRA